MFGFKSQETQEDIWLSFEEEAIPVIPDLFRVAVWLTRNRSEAEDLVQETLAAALKSFQRYQIGTNCRAWMTRILYNIHAKRLRDNGRLTLVSDSENTLSAGVAFTPPIPQNITDEDVLRAVRRVPENFRQVVILADVEDFSYREIASILDIPLGTVMSRLARGRKILRVELAEFARQRGFGKSVGLSGT